MSDDNHGLEEIPPHQLPNTLRTCVRGVLTVEEAQAWIGAKFKVLELRPAQCLADEISSDLVDATEIIFSDLRSRDERDADMREFIASIADTPDLDVGIFKLVDD